MTLSDLRALLSVANVRAFLRVIRQRESNQTDDAYSIVNGGAQFSGWANHPYAGQRTPPGRASGAYQFIASTWAEVAALYGLTDFSPANQDMGAVGRIIYRGALDDVIAGRFEAAVIKCRKEWTSLPGAAEAVSGWTMDKALAVFLQYGGGVGAPIEDKSIEYTPPIGGTQEGTSMGAALPLLASILPQVLQLFSGKAQEKITQATGADSTVAANFMQGLISQIGAAVGIPVTNNATAMQAVGAFTATPDPLKVKALEASALASVDDLIKVGDKAMTWDQALWSAQIAGKQASSSIAIEEKKAGVWDMTKTLVFLAGGTVTFAVVAMTAAILYQAIFKPDISTALIALAGPLIAIAFGVWREVFAYRFDGTKDSASQSQALVAAATSRTQPKGA